MEWITKKLVASLVNKWLGHFIEEVNSQEVNDALLGGELNLTNLKVRKDALSFLNGIYETYLPIEVLQGVIGRISLTVPYSNIFTQPLILSIQDVLLLVAPVLEYDPEEQRERERNFKNSLLQQLFQEKIAVDAEGGQAGLLGLLYNRIWNNLQLKVSNVHIRYEDTHSCSMPLVIGVCLQSLSAETTNHKWKKVPLESSTQSVSKVVEVVSAAVYLNPSSDNQRLVKQHVLTDRWVEFLSQGLRNFSINEERFKFIVSPLRCKVKIRQHITKEARVPGLLVDAMLRENVNITLEHQQYLALLQLATSFATINLNKKFQKYKPSVPLKRHSAKWWRYAYDSVVREYIRTFSWCHISSYRKLYREYVQMYKRYLVEKRDRELEADISKIEDKLNLETIVAGRMEAKILLSKEEPDLLKPVVKASCGWFSWLFGGSNKEITEEETDEVDVVASRRTNQILASMSFDERIVLKNELSSLNQPVEDRHKEDIDQKIYLSLKELTVTLKDVEKKDIGLFLMTGFVLSFETRLGVRYKKVSIKLESLSVEASNLEDDLVHVLKLVEGTSTTVAGYGITLACDFETRPLSGNEDYGVTIKLDPVEISYHQEALMRLISFFNVYDFQFLKNKMYNSCSSLATMGRTALHSAVHRRTLMALDIDIKSPYIILPEHGSIQSGGNVLVIDLGGLKVFTELGGYVKNVEEATRMELEEKLYDRITILISHFQVLFADSGDEWRVMRTRDDSELHVLPRVRMKLNIANNVYPELREHPKQKLDIHFTPLKLNLSDNRINHLIEFAQHFPTLKKDPYAEQSVCAQDSSLKFKAASLAELFNTLDYLYLKLKPKFAKPRIFKAASTPELLRHVKPLKSFDTISQTSLELAKYFPEESDEEEGNFSKPVDLLGFEDNTSPTNMIQILSRFCIDEIILSLSRSSDSGERPYLMIKVARFLVECAIMDYGPAIQVTVGSLHLVDKYHHNSTGEYLELVSSSNKSSMLTILYRKVKANCPDFKTSFHSCEQSMVVDVSSINFVWHRSAVLSLNNFLTHLPPKVSVLYTYCVALLDNSYQYLKEFYLSSSDDPPVPPGATKWSINLSVNKMAMKFCDNEIDFLYLKLSGFQCGCVFKANEKIIFKTSLSDILLEDLSDITLYSRVIEVEEDLVFDIKIVKFSRFVCDISESNKGDNLCKPDVSVSIQVGRLQCVLLYKLLSDFARFVDSFPAKEYCLCYLKSLFLQLKNNVIDVVTKCKVTLSFCIRTPNLLVPQKSDSPCLLVFNFGDFKVDNFFKPVPGISSNLGVLENVLLEIGPIEICRAVMTLGGGLELQEAILEPTKIRIDLKRSLMRQCRDVLSWDITTNVDSLYINLGQRDLNTILGVMTQNKSEAHFPERPSHSRPLTPFDNGPPSVAVDDNVGKLQAFLTHSVDIYRIAFASILLESLRITLYTDMNEILSSPVRDAATALCKFEIGEIEIRGDMNNDQSLELTITLKSCDVYDVRSDCNNFIKKIFGHLVNEAPMDHGGFKFNIPPLLDATIKVSPNGDSSTEINLDRIRLTMSVGLALAVYNYVSNAVPVSANSSCGILNPGFVEDVGTFAKNDFAPSFLKAQSSSDSTSGYQSTITYGNDDERVVSVSLKTKLPEVVLFVDPEESDSRTIVFRCHVQCDYSKHPGNESFKINLDKAVIFSLIYSTDNQHPYMIMLPCYLEGVWNIKAQEGEKISLKSSNISIHICPPVAQMVSCLIEELTEFIAVPDPIKLELPIGESEDLWSPKPLNATVFSSDLNNEICIDKRVPLRKKNQQMKISIPSLKIFFETCTSNSRTPVFALTTGVEVEMNNWSRSLYGNAQLQLACLYFNEEHCAWEYIVEPVTENEKRRSLDIEMRVVQHLARPIGMKRVPRNKCDDSFDTWSHSDRCSHKDTLANESKSSSDEEDNGNNEMVILKPSSSRMKRGSIRRNIADIPTISGYSMDSDSETEGSLLYKITSTFSHMFSSDSELSEDDLHTEVEDGSVEEEIANKNETNYAESAFLGTGLKPKQNELAVASEGETDIFPVFVEDSHNIIDDSVGIVSSRSNIGTTVIVCSKDPLEFSLTPRMVTAGLNLYNDYFNPKSVIYLPSSLKRAREVHLTNEVGPNSKISIISYEEVNGHTERKVIAESKFKELSSLPSSPGSSRSSGRDNSISTDGAANRVIDWDNLPLVPPVVSEDEHPLPSMESYSEFSVPDAVHLYQNVIKQRIRIEVSGFDTLEVFVGTRSHNRLFQLSPLMAECRYHVMVIVEISLQAVSVTVRSPLQILNDLALPINICFKKSALLNLQNDRDKKTSSPTHSLASLGSASNPFEEYPSLVTLQPDETYALPLSVAYHSPVFVAPSATDYQVSESGLWWKEMQSSTGARIIRCLPKCGEGSPISVACSLTEGVRVSSSMANEGAFVNVPNYTLRLSSPIDVYNYLPYTLVLQNKTLPMPLTLDPGGCTSIIRMDPHTEEELDVQICNYQGSDWKAVLCIPMERNEASRTLSFCRADGVTRGKVDVSLYTSRDVTTSVYVYVPYWIVNKTRLPLQVRGTRSKFSSESSGNEEILLFRYKKNHPHKMKIKVLESDWSRGWCCDAVGTCGVVICEDKLRNKKFRILAKITQSTLKAYLPVDGRKGSPKPMFQLTRIVTLMPYFLVRNTTYRALMYMQESDKNGLWFDIGPNQCESFWPNSDDMYLVVRRQDTQVISQRFHFNSLHKTVLRLEKGRGMVVTVDGVGSDEPVTVTFSKYRTGDAPVRLENWCDDVFLRFHQRGSNQVTLLAPRQSILYTWDDSTLPRELLWNIYSKKDEDFTAVINLDKHGTEKVTLTSVKHGSVRTQSQSCCGTPKVRPKRATHRPRARTTPSTSSTEEEELPDGWLLVGKEKKGHTGLSPSKGQNKSHLRGTQRDKMVVHWVCHRQGNQRVLLFTQSDRLAYLTKLPNERARMEFILSVNQIGISVINNSYKEIVYGGIFPSTPVWQLEVDGVWKVPPSMELCSWLEDQYLYNKDAQVNLKGSMQVDLLRMRMLAPFSGRLRRIKQPALWVHYRHSPHYAYCRAKINVIQIDNQTEDAVYPNVLTSHRDKNYEKPCFDFCLMMHCDASKIHTIRHFSVIGQELSVNLDRGFLMAAREFTQPFNSYFSKNSIHSELKTLLTPLTFSSNQRADKYDDGSSRVERFCFAGLQLGVSLSPKGISPSEKTPDLLVGALASLGITLGEVKNVVIKVSQLESEATSQTQVLKDLTSHIQHQVLQQLYVLILGLDILGNPYQRLKDLIQGVRELVFDASTGIAERPDDYADEISDEAFSLCGHVTGDETHNFRLLNSYLDVDVRNFIIKDNKMKFKSLNKAHSVDSSLMVNDGSIPVRMLSGVGLAWSLTGMVIDPMSASLQESIECLLRGRARGLVGLISNPSFGVNNPIGMATDGLRRTQTLGYEAYFRVRAQRHSSQYSPLKPVCQHECEGLALMVLMPQRFLCNSDKYFGHVYLSNSKHPPIFLATVRHFYYMEPYGNWGRCEIVWKMSVRNLSKQPTQSDDIITFQLRQDDAQSHLSGSVRLIQCSDNKVLDDVMSLVTSLMTLQMENLPCPMAS